MLGSGNDGPAAPDGDAPRVPDYIDPAITYDASVTPDDVDPVIPVVNAPMARGDDAPMIPDAGVPVIPRDTALRSGWYFGILLGILIPQFFSYETQTRSLSSLSVYAKLTRVAGRSAPDSSAVCLLSNASSTLGLDLVRVAS